MTDALKNIETTGSGGSTTTAKLHRAYSPAVDIIKRKDEIEVVADMPGVDEGAIEVTLEKNELTLYGRVAAEQNAGYEVELTEYGVGDYKRVFSISDEIDRDRIRAAVKNGVLRITLPKAEVVKSRRIAVATAE